MPVIRNFMFFISLVTARAWKHQFQKGLFQTGYEDTQKQDIRDKTDLG